MYGVTLDTDYIRRVRYVAVEVPFGYVAEMMLLLSIEKTR